MTMNKKYLRLDNPTEDEVNQLISLGYKLHSVNAWSEEVTKDHRVITYTTKLVYHFIQEEAN